MTPTVAIVGRPNVGKSALFNRLARRDLSIVHDKPGVTRDRLVTSAEWDGKPYSLVDTGGIGLGDSEGFADAIEHEVQIALETATHILFVVDIREGVTPLDQEICRRLRKTKCPVFLVLNKADHEKQSGLDAEFSHMNFGHPYPVSAMHGIGIETLMQDVASDWEAADAPPPRLRPTRVAMIGRPNVGKSSLINAILNETRTIVSEIPGTTRDAVDVPFRWDDRDYVLIDTAGMRKKSRVNDPLEQKMTGRTAHMINRADVCVLVLETNEGVREQDKKIAGLIQNSKCPCVIALNKWDIAQDQGDGGTDRRKEFAEGIRNEIFFLPYAKVHFVSAKTRSGLPKLLETIHAIHKLRHFKFQTSQLNKVLQHTQERYVAPNVKGKRFKIYYAAQQFSEDPRAIPTLLFFVNSPDLLTDAYRRYIEIQIRQAFPLEGCPIEIHLRARRPEKAPQRIAKRRIIAKGAASKNRNRF